MARKKKGKTKPKKSSGPTKQSNKRKSNTTSNFFWTFFPRSNCKVSLRRILVNFYMFLRKKVRNEFFEQLIYFKSAEISVSDGWFGFGGPPKTFFVPNSEVSIIISLKTIFRFTLIITGTQCNVPVQDCSDTGSEENVDCVSPWKVALAPKRCNSEIQCIKSKLLGIRFWDIDLMHCLGAQWTQGIWLS